MAAGEVKFAKGSRVAFLEDKLSWTLGTIVKYEKGAKKDVIVCTADAAPGKEFTVSSPLKLYLARDELFEEEPNDLLMLTELHEATLLACLKRRFMRDVVYTNIGTLIVAMNPFKRIPCYQPEVAIKDYLAEGPVVQNQLPHCWSVAHQTYFELVNDRQDQTILISGESGAGKTVAAKIVVEYLTAVSCQKATAETKAATEEVGVKVQAASPILESFGNAKTVRNDNSSRFGKFMKIQFDRDGFLVGAHTTKYLLEKSRIISAAQNERIYHVFYQIVAHADQEKYGLVADAEKYTSCNTGKCLTIDGVNDSEDQQACIDAMGNIGMEEDEKTSIWRTVAGILHLQNTVIEEKTEQNNPVSYVGEEQRKTLQAACTQLCIDAEVMERELTTTTSNVGGASMTKKLSCAQALDIRDSVCKRVYDGMFQWLVNKINGTTDAGDKCDNWLGLLDIFGFECFEFNSFEQICINLANEALQSHYNNYIFVEDKKECEREGIDTTDISFSDNQACLDLLTGKNSIFTALDVECGLPKGGDESFLSKLHDTFGPQGSKPGHDFYGKPRGETDRKNPNSFIVHHYAGNVIYNVAGWMEKNKEPLKDEMVRLCNSSTDKLIQGFLPPPPDSGRPAQKITVSGNFKEQVGQLIGLINTTNPHWIRCVKPHPAKKPLMWEPCQVMDQLRSAGVIETIRVRKAGYPIRFKHRLFRERYGALLGSAALSGSNLEDDAENRQSCQTILDRLSIGKDIGQMGHTKVFLRQPAFIRLNTEKDVAVARYILKIQKAARARIGRHKAFLLYVLKHKARIEEEGREKVAAEARAREAAVLQKQQEEQAQRDQEQRFAVLRESSALVLQRNVRGHLARVAVLRCLVESQRAAEEERIDQALLDQRSVFSESDAHRLSVEQAEERLSQRLKPVSYRQLEIEVRKQFKKQQTERRQAYDEKLSESRRLREERIRKEEDARRKRLRKRDEVGRKVVASAEVGRRAEEKFLRSLEKKEAQTGLVGEERAHHFRQACLRFEARDDWEHNREEYLSRDYERRRQQESVMRGKQHLIDHDLYRHPPNPMLCPDMSVDHGVRTTLTQKQLALEASYQERVQREYSLLCSLGKDPIEALQREREQQLKQRKELRRKSRPSA